MSDIVTNTRTGGSDGNPASAAPSGGSKRSRLIRMKAGLTLVWLACLALIAWRYVWWLHASDIASQPFFATWVRDGAKDMEHSFGGWLGNFAALTAATLPAVWVFHRSYQLCSVLCSVAAGALLFLTPKDIEQRVQVPLVLLALVLSVAFLAIGDALERAKRRAVERRELQTKAGRLAQSKRAEAQARFDDAVRRMRVKDLVAEKRVAVRRGRWALTVVLGAVVFLFAGVVHIAAAARATAALRTTSASSVYGGVMRKGTRSSSSSPKTPASTRTP